MGVVDQITRSDYEVYSEIETITKSLEEIVKLAMPRLVMVGIRYGSNWKHEKLMNYMQAKFSEYRKTGNFEMLVDLVNFCAIEGDLKTHPKFNFTPKDRTTD